MGLQHTATRILFAERLHFERAARQNVCQNMHVGGIKLLLFEMRLLDYVFDLALVDPLRQTVEFCRRIGYNFFLGDGAVLYPAVDDGDICEPVAVVALPSGLNWHYVS